MASQQREASLVFTGEAATPVPIPGIELERREFEVREWCRSRGVVFSEEYPPEQRTPTECSPGTWERTETHNGDGSQDNMGPDTHFDDSHD